MVGDHMGIQGVVVLHFLYEANKLEETRDSFLLEIKVFVFVVEV
jgi:hypothetical protein